jgi:hypothetical protein
MSEEDRLTEKELKKSLKDSVEEVGYLYPAIKTPDGEVIAGKHRLDADPAWPVVVREDLDTPVKIAQVKIVENLIRRIVPDDEKTQMLADLAKALIEFGFEGNIVKELSKRTKRSVRWVQQYLPEEYKDMKMVRKPDPDATKIDDIIKIDIRKYLELDTKERKEQGMTWRDIMKRHKIGSQKVANLKKEVEEEIKAQEILEKELKRAEGQEQMLVAEIVGIPDAGKSATTMKQATIVQDEDPEPTGVGARTTETAIEDVVHVEEKSPIDGASHDEVIFMISLRDNINEFLKNYNSLEKPTTYGQGIASTMVQLMKVKPFEPYESA